MIKKIIGVALLSTIVHAANAAPQKVESYDVIKQTLLEGKALKAIVDFGKCKITMGDTGKPVKQIIGLMIENFMISDYTKAITTSHNFLNSIDKRTPYGRIGYRLGDIAVMPDNEVIVETAVMRVDDKSIVGQLRFSCKMSDAANFYVME